MSKTNTIFRYSARVKKIVNQARVNEVDNLESFMDSYWVEIEALRRQIAEAKLHGESKVDDLKKLKEVELHKAHLERDKSEKEATHLRTELVREIKITKVKYLPNNLYLYTNNRIYEIYFNLGEAIRPTITGSTPPQCKYYRI